MYMEYQVISDSSCDLEADLKEKYNIEVVPFFVSFEEEKYYKEIEEIAIRDIMKAKKVVLTKDAVAKIEEVYA